jgi:uncharacterized protein (TIGR03083 family)
MKRPEPILVAHLFPEVLDALLGLLAGLSPEDWDRHTACGSWTVKDVALHLLGDEVGNLARRRDGFSPGGSIAGCDELVTFINDWNRLWVEATRRMSTRTICDLLGFVGRQAVDYFGSMDPYAIGGPVSWAGPDAAPVWLDLAREYTERWLHQRHIRDAVGVPGLRGPRHLAPVLDAFVRALPRTYEDVRAPKGTVVSLTIAGPSGGQWFLQREPDQWALYLDTAREPDAAAVLHEDDAWRIFTRGIGREASLNRIATSGDEALAIRVLDTVSIIA